MTDRRPWVAALPLLLAACIPNQQYEPQGPALPPPDPYAGEARQVEPTVADDRDQPPIDDRRLPLPQPAQPQTWEIRPVTPDAQEVADGDYVVQPGDTLRAIANKTGAGSEAIARVNGIEAPFIIQVGQRLRIPGGRYHLVRAGETGIAIARAYGVPWSAIVDANALTDPYILRAGQRIIIPSSGEVRDAPGDMRPAPTQPLPAIAGATPARPQGGDRDLQLIIDDLVTGSQPALAANQPPVPPSPSPNRLPAPGATIAEPAHLAGGFAWPVNGAVVKRFGRGASGERNDGIKIAVPIDTPIKASADGVVAYTGSGVAGLGGLVILRHGDGWTTVYGHADKLLVQRGQSVKRGQPIALSGDTGFADRPEVHFEMRKGRTPVDPLATLPAR